MASVEPFASLDELEREHVAMLEELDRSCEGVAVATESIAERAFLEQNHERILCFIARAAATGRILHGLSERRPAQQMLDRWASTLFRFGMKQETGATLASFDENAAPDLKDKAWPYVGLEAFDEKDAPRFFGREERTKSLLAAVRDYSFVFVSGASGSGKSSLVLAGLLPALKNDALPGSSHWVFVPTIVPGPFPLSSLARQLCAAFPDCDSAAVLSALRADPAYLAELLHLKAKAPCVMVVDQFEEVFSLRTPESADETRAFTAALVGLARIEGSPHKIVATFRKDREGDLAGDADLQKLYFERLFVVSSMLPDELRATIERPAASVGLIIERDVVESLVNTFTGDETGLPLLQFCLVELWQRRSRNRVTHKTLAALGDPKFAMASVAGEIYNDLAQQGREATKQVLLQLSKKIEGHEFLRVRKTRAELWAIVGNKTTVDDVIQRFADRRLLKITRAENGESAGDTIEVAHEALLRNWQEFRRWTVEEGGRLDQRNFVARQAALWADRVSKHAVGADHQDTTGLLLSGIALRQAMADIYEDFPKGSVEQRFLDVSKQKAEYVEAALRRDADAAKQSARRNLYGLVVAVSAVVIIGGLAWTLHLNKRTLETLSTELRAKQLGTFARQFCESDPALAARLGHHAFELAGLRRGAATKDAMATVHCMIHSPQKTIGVVSVPNQLDAPAFALSGDGRQLVTGDRQGAIREWSLAAGEPTLSRQMLGNPFFPVAALAYSPDGKLVLAGWSGTGGSSAIGNYCPPGEQCGALGLWSRSDNEPLALLQSGSISHVLFNRDGSKMAVVSAGATRSDGAPSTPTQLRIWDVGEVVGRRSFEHPSHDLAIDEGVARLAIGSGTADFMLVTRGNSVLRVTRGKTGYASQSLPMDKCESPFAVAVGPEWLARAQPGRMCLSTSLNAKRETLEGANIRNAVLRGNGDILVMLSVGADRSADLVVRDLKRDSQPIVLSRAFEMDPAVACGDASQRAPGMTCGDFEASVQTSSDGNTVAVRSPTTGTIDIYRVAPGPTRFGWLRQAKPNVAFSRDDALVGLLDDGETGDGDVQSRKPRDYVYRVHDTRSGAEMRQIRFRHDGAALSLELIDGTGGRFATRDLDGFKVWSVRNDSAFIEDPHSPLAIPYPQQEVFTDVRFDTKSGHLTECKVYRLSAPREPIWKAIGPLSGCQVSDDARVAITRFVGKEGRTFARVQDIDAGDKGAQTLLSDADPLTSYFVTGDDTKFVLSSVPTAGATQQSHVTVYAWSGGKLLKRAEYEGPTPIVTAASFKPFAVDPQSGTFLVTEADDRVIARRLDGGAALPVPAANGMDPRGRYMITRSGSKTWITDVRNRQNAVEVEPGSRVSFGADGKRAIAARGNRVVIYDLEARSVLADVPFPAQAIRFSAAGTHLIVRTASGAYLLPLDVEQTKSLIGLGEASLELTDSEKCYYANEQDACIKLGRETK